MKLMKWLSERPLRVFTIEPTSLPDSVSNTTPAPLFRETRFAVRFNFHVSRFTLQLHASRFTLHVSHFTLQTQSWTLHTTEQQ